MPDMGNTTTITDALYKMNFALDRKDGAMALAWIKTFGPDAMKRLDRISIFIEEELEDLRDECKELEEQCDELAAKVQELTDRNRRLDEALKKAQKP